MYFAKKIEYPAIHTSLTPQKYQDIEVIFKTISLLHTKFSEGFLETEKSQCINLKKKQVRHIVENEFIEESFLVLIQKYHDRLFQQTIEMELEYYYLHLDFRSRIKQKDSTIRKLIFYKEIKGEKGFVPINKCLNDFFGFRIVIDDFDYNCNDFDELYERLKEEFNLKKENASKENYKGVHIYFSGGNNLFFPWELQIWSKADVENNEKSHEDHRSTREYIKWPHEYKASEAHFSEGGVR